MGRICCETRSPLFLIMDNNENNVTIYVGDKMVKVAKGKSIVKPSNCPQYYWETRGLSASSSLNRDAPAESGTGVKARSFLDQIILLK